MRASLRIIACVTAVACVPFLATTTQRSHIATAAEPIVIRIGLVPNDDAATPLLYAQKTGMFARAGLDVRVSPQTSGAAVTAAVMGGGFDVGKSSIVPLINAHLRGLPLAIIAPASIWDGKAKFAQLLVRGDAPLRGGADLNGKLIGVQSLNDLSQLATNAYVDRHGGDSRSLRFVEIPMSAGAVALDDRRIDAEAFVEPALEGALSSGKLKALEGAFDDIAPRYLFAAWFAKNDWATDHRDAVRAFARVLADAATYTNAHHAETAEMVSTFTSIPVEMVRRMTRTPTATALRAADIQPVIDASVKYHVVTHGFSAAEMIAGDASALR